MLILAVIMTITVSPREIEILGWCLAGSVLPMGRRCHFSLGWPPFSDGITIKIPYVLLRRPASHHIFSYWVG